MSANRLNAIHLPTLAAKRRPPSRRAITAAACPVRGRKLPLARAMPPLARWWFEGRYASLRGPALSGSYPRHTVSSRRSRFTSLCESRTSQALSGCKASSRLRRPHCAPAGVSVWRHTSAYRRGGMSHTPPHSSGSCFWVALVREPKVRTESSEKELASFVGPLLQWVLLRRSAPPRTLAPLAPLLRAPPPASCSCFTPCLRPDPSRSGAAFHAHRVSGLSAAAGRSIIKNGSFDVRPLPFLTTHHLGGFGPLSTFGQISNFRLLGKPMEGENFWRDDKLPTDEEE